MGENKGFSNEIQYTKAADKFFRKHGSYYPGFSNGVKVTIKRGGHSYRGTAFAVRNYKGMRCEVRGLPYGERASTWGDY